jgi:hypothetical protein
VPLAFSVVVFLACAPIVAYLADWCGLRIEPFVVLPAAALAAGVTFVCLRRAADRWVRTCPAGDVPSSETATFLVIVSVLLAWLLWLARPSLLPPGSGPDLTHHLALVDYIEVHWRLPHDPQLAAVLGEMVNYTPGAHLLGALAGAWTRTDGLHAIYTVVALTVGLKAGVIFLIARRMMPSNLPDTPLALSAVLLLLQPRDYFIGSFAEASYLAQVVSELFAMAMWLGVILWMEHPSLRHSLLIAACGAATFLAWPVALGPVLVLAVAAMACRLDFTIARRLSLLGAAIAPVAAVALLHSAGRTGAAAIVSGAGYVAYPRVDLFGSGFLAAAAIGAVTAAFDRRSRTVAVLLGATAVQSAALLIVARRAGAARPYMALKMVYFAIYPMAVAAAVALAGLLAVMQAGIGRLHATLRNLLRSGASRGSSARPTARAFSGSDASPSSLSLLSIMAWTIVAALGLSAVRSMIRAPRPRPAVSQSLFLAGDWARTHLPPECVDYVVSNVYSAYWLHIAVLRNARAAPRSVDDDTYQPEQQRIRWIEPDGLPYAVAEDFDQLPKDLRTNVDVVVRFGPAAIIKRRGRAACAG